MRNAKSRKIQYAQFKMAGNWDGSSYCIGQFFAEGLIKLFYNLKNSLIFGS